MSAWASRDVLRVTEAVPDAHVIAVHLNAINHCLLSRNEQRAAVLGRRASLPADGGALDLG